MSEIRENDKNENFFAKLSETFGVQIECPDNLRNWVRTNIAEFVEWGVEDLKDAQGRADRMRNSPMQGMLWPLIRFFERKIKGFDSTQKEHWENRTKRVVRLNIRLKLMNAESVRVVLDKI